jgi:hypothetical protein
MRSAAFRDVSDGLARGRIDHDRVGGSSKEKALALVIKRGVVPSSFASDLKGSGQFVRLSRGCISRGDGQAEQHCEQGRGIEDLFCHGILQMTTEPAAATSFA